MKSLDKKLKYFTDRRMDTRHIKLSLKLHESGATYIYDLVKDEKLPRSLLAHCHRSQPQLFRRVVLPHVVPESGTAPKRIGIALTANGKQVIKRMLA